MEAKIKLKVKDVEIELTVEEAKDLVKLLEEMTGLKPEVVKQVIEKHIHHDYTWWWPQTIYVEKRYPELTWWYDSTCNTDSVTNQISDNVSISYSIAS